MNTMHSPRVPTSSARRRPVPLSPPSVGGVTDNFDAPTTEAQTDWNTTGIEGVEGRDYSVSVSGYRNYVNEMERMLGGEVNVHLDQVPPAARNGPEHSKRKEREVRYPPESVHETDPSVNGQRPGLGSYASLDNVRHVSGRRGRVELVEHKIMEDGPERTISLWRERVAAQSGDGSSRYGDVSARGESVHGRGHRRVISAEEYYGGRPDTRYAGGSRGQGQSSTSYIPRKSKEVPRDNHGDYERTEYMVSYHNPSRSMSGLARHVYTPSESISGMATVGHRRASSTTTRPTQGLTSIVTNTQPSSLSTRRTSGRSSFERTESVKHMVTYLHTPPLSQGSERDSPKRHGSQATNNHSMSTIRSRVHHPIERPESPSILKGVSTSPVELVLATCEPSLLHIAPVLSDLGILKLEHLRAMARMSEETRDRELKGIALLRGVTVMEWAILLDKLQTL